VFQEILYLNGIDVCLEDLAEGKRWLITTGLVEYTIQNKTEPKQWKKRLLENPWIRCIKY
jgi:hypothetical protein